VVGLAGCSGDDDNDGNGGGNDDTGDGDTGDDDTGNDLNIDALTIAGGPSEGTAWYLGAATWGEWARELWGLNVTVQTGGGESNTVRVASGDIDIGWSFTNTPNEAYLGEGAFDESLEDLRLGISFWPAFVMSVGRDPIQTYPDMEGETITAGGTGLTGYTAFDNILNQYGLSLGEDVDHQDAGFSEIPGLYQDGIVQGMSLTGTRVNHPVLSSVFAQDTGHLIPFEGEEREAYLEAADRLVGHLDGDANV